MLLQSYIVSVFFLNEETVVDVRAIVLPLTVTWLIHMSNTDHQQSVSNVFIDYFRRVSMALQLPNHFCETYLGEHDLDTYGPHRS